MARVRRGGDMELNSDGLTDAVTNLTGTLILLVVLMFGITHDVPPNGPPPPDPTGKPIAPLRRRIEMLKLEIEGVDTQIRALEQRIPELEREVEQLQTEAGKSIEKGDHPPPRIPAERITLARPGVRAAQLSGGIR